MKYRDLIAAATLALVCVSCSGENPVAAGRAVKLGHVNSTGLKEISGMAASRVQPGILWVHNDGDKPWLSALSTNGDVRAQFRLNAKITDTEDIAIGPGQGRGRAVLYLGDIGDNNANRKSVRVYRFPEPLIAGTHNGEADETIKQFETMEFRYPDGAHDAEALMIDPRTGELFIATKEKRRSRLYAASGEQLVDGASVMLRQVGEVAFAEVSGADISPNGSEIILRRENAARLWHREKDESVEAALRRTPTAIPVVGPPVEPNGESIAFDAAGAGYFTISEGKRPAIYFLSPL